MSTTYETLLSRAADLYYAARANDPLAVVVETIMESVTSEIDDFKTLDRDNDAQILEYIDFVADSKGYTVTEILGDRVNG